MPTETQILTYLAQTEAIARAHPNWTAFRAWAQGERAVFNASRARWRAQSPAINVELQEAENSFDLSPALASVINRPGDEK